MSKAWYRSAYACGVVVAVLSCAGDVRAEEPAPLEARMQCERAAEPGRVRCSVELHVEGPRSLAWADVAILQLPDFASALKGRIGPDEATSRDASGYKWAFGVVARRAGQGEARARVRAVTCEGGGETPAPSRCVPQTVEVRAMLNVGG